MFALHAGGSSLGVYKNSDWAFGAFSARSEVELTRAPMKLVCRRIAGQLQQCGARHKGRPVCLNRRHGWARNAQVALQAISFHPGAVLSAKLDNVKVMSAPAREAEVVAKLARTKRWFSGRISRRVYIDSGRRCRGLGARDSDWRMILCGCSSMVERGLA